MRISDWSSDVCSSDLYDDLRGWDPLPYLAQEFYLEYGDFDYWLTVPADMIVAGSGELMNPDEVLTKAQVARLEKAKASNATGMIRSPQEMSDPASRPKRDRKRKRQNPSR